MLAVGLACSVYVCFFVVLGLGSTVFCVCLGAIFLAVRRQIVKFCFWLVPRLALCLPWPLFYVRMLLLLVMPFFSSTLS